MPKYNLLSEVRRKKFHYCSQYLHRYPNSLNRDISAEKPNQKWVTDISYIKQIKVLGVFYCQRQQGVLVMVKIFDFGYDNLFKTACHGGFLHKYAV